MQNGVLTVQKITRRNKNRKTGAQPNLVSSAPPPAFVRTTDWATVRIAKKFGLSVEHASTVARLAGIGSEV
jgi:hypothetical protein